MLSVKPVSFPLPRSLSRYAPAVRLRRADGTHRRVIAITGKKEPVEKPRRCRFSIGSAPDKHHRNGRSNQRWRNPTGLKDTRRPWWLPVRSPVPAFRFTGVIPLLWPRLSHSTPDTQFREGSSLQAGLYARTPVQSDCCALSGNYRLESNPERHAKAPLAAATGN